MAATIFPTQTGSGSPSPLHGMYPHNLISDLDFGDNRYPSIAPNRRGAAPAENAPSTSSPPSALDRGPPSPPVADDNGGQRSPRLGSAQWASTSSQQPATSPVGESSPRQAAYPMAFGLEGSSSRPLSHSPETSSRSPGPPPAEPTPMPPAITPLSAAPGYIPPVSTRNRAYVQQPTFITQNQTPTAVNPIYSSKPLQEEVCVECAMRDQDMADVDVTSPGVWDRESDAQYEDLKAREAEEAATGVINTDSPPRPRATGGRLSEQNLKIWLSIIPREPASRQVTLSNYVSAQRKLIEAEVLAHAQAMQEAKQLDNRMRDAYSALRRSAYDTGAAPAPTDDTGGVRIRPPRSTSGPKHDRDQSRDVTLLENGMIVEHVDVRREEREARERRRKEERRARKSSRSSVVDMTSVMSTPSLPTHPDSGVGLRPYSTYSLNNSPGRPMSVLTVPPDMPRAQSQASFSEVHSLGSGSPRMSRFFGFSNFNMSRDSLAPSAMISGSMMDMHVALQREDHKNALIQYNYANDMGKQLYNESAAPGPSVSRHSLPAADKPKKKKGLAKIWSIVTRSTKQDGQKTMPVNGRHDDEPLAPPPPLSYLLNREGRHVSSPSLTSNMRSSPTSATGPSASTTHLPSSPTLNSDSSYNLARRPEDSDERLSRNLRSDPDLRRYTQSPSSSSPSHTATPATPNIGQSTAMSREKSLPPLPGEVPQHRFLNAENRPQTVYTYDRSQDLLPPKAPFRTGDMRRQSFNGLASRPNLDALQGPSTVNPASRSGFLPNQYDEFGGSQRSLASAGNRGSLAPAKRRSKFGLSSLFGKKDAERNSVNNMQENAAAQASFRRSGDTDRDGDMMSMSNGGYATSMSRHSMASGATGNGALPIPGSRMSVMSRKALEELVAQDTDFVAYRYPSNDQRLDLLR
ncbi:hypothetical protein CYLTODRAFT_495367 [Cylindrobasidium torrendii FP15055 ss-10]|uniref:Uncharacterized protein n=1 Tax=Cylindrobasidium torrendii FP15055 ss-10 TaxID=1314674 RepID=A0A0D7AT85_9AGAR|nr:hypothetical protein CYLTODRAFT_495367 [Cylindrobasidium torrendii FP15055 ss-10]